MQSNTANLYFDTCVFENIVNFDNSKFEKEADKGRVMFRAFNKYVNKLYKGNENIKET